MKTMKTEGYQEFVINAPVTGGGTEWQLVVVHGGVVVVALVVTETIALKIAAANRTPVVSELDAHYERAARMVQQFNNTQVLLALAPEPEVSGWVGAAIK